MKQKRGKKGQFFIIFAVIIGLLILGLATIFNVTIKTGKENTGKKFEILCENYKEEIYRISQYAINNSNKNQEKDLILDFTKNFTSYAEKSDPNFQLIYVYGNIDKIIKFNSTTNQDEEILNPSNPYTVQIKNIIKEYELLNDNKFWFIMLTKKDGEEYVCE